MATVTLRGIIKQYPGAPDQTLKGIDLAIRDGEFLVLVGPSGCGKSTLLRIVAGLESITEGDLLIGDRVVNAMPPKERDIAMVFQSYALYPHMTVRKNMAFGLEVRKTPRAEVDEAVGQAAQMLGLEAHLEKLPKALSGGQRQRVAMGRAIVRRPRVFLFDEPLSNLDAALRAQMRVEIKQLHRNLATTMVYVTHDQVEAMTLADRIAVLDKGILQQVGTPMELFDTPVNKFVAGFIGSPSMNFVDATIAAAGDARQLDFDRDGCVGIAASDGLEVGRSVTVGIRPQDVELAGEASPDVTARLTLVETLGWESHLHLELAESRMLASVHAHAARALEIGSDVGLHLPAEKLHIFDADTEAALVHAPAPRAAASEATST